MKLISFTLWLCAGIFFIACGSKAPEPTAQEPAISEMKLVLIKSQRINFYDYANLTTYPELSVELFKLGKSIGKLIVEESKICIKSAQINDCQPKWVFNKTFFGPVSYDTLLEEILLKKDIFEGIGREISNTNALIQRFKFGGDEFYYERASGRIYFKNISKNLIISIEDKQ